MDAAIERVPELTMTRVVCDQHGTIMQFGSVRIGHGYITSALDGWKCMVPGCERFYGTDFSRSKAGYADLDGRNGNDDLVNYRTDPTCTNGNAAVGMYLGRREASLLWIVAHAMCLSTPLDLRIRELPDVDTRAVATKVIRIQRHLLPACMTSSPMMRGEGIPTNANPVAGGTCTYRSVRMVKLMRDLVGARIRATLAYNLTVSVRTRASAAYLRKPDNVAADERPPDSPPAVPNVRHWISGQHRPTHKRSPEATDITTVSSISIDSGKRGSKRALAVIDDIGVQRLFNSVEVALLLCALPVPLAGPEPHDNFGVVKQSRRNHDNCGSTYEIRYGTNSPGEEIGRLLACDDRQSPD
jgi:hypothetical protein